MFVLFFMCYFFFFFFFFFFSSRRRHTRYIGDWSSDVCSSDLGLAVSSALAAAVDDEGLALLLRQLERILELGEPLGFLLVRLLRGGQRSEERRVGKECRSRGWRDQ